MLNVVKLSTFNFSLKLASVQSRGPGNLIVRRDQHCHWNDRGDKYKGLFTYYTISAAAAVDQLHETCYDLIFVLVGGALEVDTILSISIECFLFYSVY